MLILTVMIKNLHCCFYTKRHYSFILNYRDKWATLIRWNQEKDIEIYEDLSEVVALGTSLLITQSN